MNKEHTPGPWTVRVGKIGSQEHIWVAALQTVIGHTIAGPVPQDILCDEDYPTKLADATLIAAAPDLLAVCIELRKKLRIPPTREGEEMHNKLVDVIKKATGT